MPDGLENDEFITDYIRDIRLEYRWQIKLLLNLKISHFKYSHNADKPFH